MSVYDDPNRQALGLAPAWVEGTGGEETEPEPEPPVEPPEGDAETR